MDINTHRYYILSAYPNIELDEETGEIIEWKQNSERLKFTVQAEFINEDFDFTKPVAPKTPADPKNAPGD